MATRPVALFLAFVAVSVATRWLSLVVDVLDIDETAHIVGAWEMERGRTLYREFVDNKPPLLYVYYLAAQWVFGRGLLAVHAMTALAMVPLTALGVSAFVGHGRRGALAGLTFLLYSSAFLAHDMQASHTEVLLVAPATWALVLQRNAIVARRPLAALGAGGLLGIACLVKYPMIAWLAAFVVALVWSGRDRQRAPTARALGLLVFGWSVPLAVTGARFAADGALSDLVYWTIRNNFVYVANPIAPREALERALSYLVPFLLVTGPLWWGSLKARRAWDNPHSPALLAGTLAATLVTAFLGFRFFPHYFVPLYPPLAIAASPWLTRVLRAPRARASRAFLGWTACMVAGFMVANAALYHPESEVYRERSPVFRLVGERLRRDPCAPGPLFVWGYAPMFYYYADLPAASRFVVLAQARVTPYVSGNIGAVEGEEPGGDVVARHWDWLMSDLETRQAIFVIDTAPAGIFRWDNYPVEDSPRLYQYVRDHFELVEEVNRVRLYRRRGCANQATGGAPH